MILFVILILLIIGIQNSNERNASTFLPTYFIKTLKIDQKTAAYCESVLSTSFTIGRFLNIFLTMKMEIETMLFINFCSMIAGNCLIWTVGGYSLFGVYAGLILLGYGFSNTFPIIIAYVEERVTLSNKIMSLTYFSGAVFSTGTPFLIGKFLNTKPTYFILLNLLITLFAFLMFIILFVLEKLRLTNNRKRERKL